MQYLIFGCGYLGRRVARLLVAAGGEVFAVTRSPAKAAELSALGCRPIVADVTDPATLGDLPDVGRVLFAVGYDRAPAHGAFPTTSLHSNISPALTPALSQGEKAQRGLTITQVYEGGVRAALSSLPTSVERFVYISSTGVYSQSGDQWVDEDSPCRPTREGGQACLAAERAIATDRLGPRTIILRMAGLYGPDRIPYLDRLRSGAPIPAPRTGWLNLVHVEDAARIVVAALDHATAPRVFCVSDGHPVSRKDYYAKISQLLGAPPPSFLDDPDTPAAARAASSKRVSSARMAAELYGEWRYPSYAQGLAALLDAD